MAQKTLTQAQPDTVSISSDAGLDALKAITMPDIDDDEQDQDAGSPIDENGNVIQSADEFDADLMTKDVFWGAFKGMFGFGAAMFPNGPMPELAIQSHEEMHARSASDATWELMRAFAPQLLRENNDRIGQIIVAGSFFAMKAKIVAAVLRARKMDAVDKPRDDKGQFSTTRTKPDTPNPAQPQPDLEADWEIEVQAA